MNRHIRAFYWGIAAFVAQLFLSAASQLNSVSAKSEALAWKAFSYGWASTGLLLVLASYFVLGVLAHAIPFLLVTKIFEDLRRKGSNSIKKLLASSAAQPAYLLATLLLMLMANQWLFPGSSAAPNFDLLLAQTASGFLLYGLPAIAGAAVIYWLAACASLRTRLLTVAIGIIACAAWASPEFERSSEAKTRKKPDVIVIGVDSLRPDHLKTYGYPGDSLAPTIERFVAEGRRFDRAHTTQGRTFVAYMSILSGLYPTHHGARENLYPASLYRKDASIAHKFANNGYTTLFAMDEARFANFDRSFGFSEMVSPPPGVADFIVGTFLDTAGTNLLQRAPYADALLPHVAGNRAAATIYTPAVFDRRLGRAVRAANSSKPLFLVSHFCIAHIPYAYSTKQLEPLAAPYEDSSIRYRAAVRIADSQVEVLLKNLRTAGRLENAVVVLLSDHGEGLGMEKDRWRAPSGQSTWPATYGHGGYALDESESRVVLTFQRYRHGKPVLPSSASRGPVSLVDIAPTLLTMADIDYVRSIYDGQTLLTADGGFSPSPEKPLFIESGLSGVSLQKKDVNPGEVADEFSLLYRITPDLRFELQKEFLPRQMQAKQRAVIWGRYGLSTRPVQRDWIKLDLETNTAENLPVGTNDPIVRAYRPLLCAHFKADAAYLTSWCLPPPPLRGTRSPSQTHG